MALPDLPICEARHLDGERILCRHPLVNAHGHEVPATLCAICPHRQQPATLRTIAEVLNPAPAPPAPHRGLGDTVSGWTKAVGIEPCGGCQGRQATLNRWFPSAWAKQLAKITFGITAFERPRHLERLVASIQRFYPDARIVVADNGRQKANLPPSVKVLNLPYDCGLSAARNALIAQLETPYLLVLEEDFIFTSETRIERFVDVLEQHPEVGCVGGSLVHAGNRQAHAVDFHLFAGTFTETKSTGHVRVTDRGTPYRLADKVYNFFLARREMLAQHHWQEALKVGEHTAFFWDVSQAGKWLVAHCAAVAAVHDQSGRTSAYQAHRARATGYMSHWHRSPRIKAFQQQRQVRNDAPTLHRPNILVYGVGHSGTSILTRMLAPLGWALPGADREFSEHVGIRQLNQQILAGKTFSRRELADKLRALPEPWAIKDPRFHRTLQSWLPALADLERPPVLLWIRRDKAATVGSYARRGNEYADTPAKFEAAHARAQAGFDLWPWAKTAIEYEDLAAAVAMFQKPLEIPRVFHRIWIGDKPLPERHANWIEQWKVLHPHWGHRLWGEREILATLSPYWRGFYERANTLAGKADIARYVIVHDYGGVYLDTDRSCLKPIDELLVGCQCFLSYATPAGIVTNNIFGAVPGHPFLARVLERFPACFDPHKPNKSGPFMFTDIAKNRGDVRIFERRILDPVADGDRHKLATMTEFPGSYSVHYYEASWVRGRQASA